MNNCKNCQFWNAPVDDIIYDEEMRTQFGYCESPLMRDISSHTVEAQEGLSTVEACYADSEGVAAAFITGECFGCLAWGKL